MRAFIAFLLLALLGMAMAIQHAEFMELDASLDPALESDMDDEFALDELQAGDMPVELVELPLTGNPPLSADEVERRRKANAMLTRANDFLLDPATGMDAIMQKVEENLNYALKEANNETAALDALMIPKTLDGCPTPGYSYGTVEYNNNVNCRSYLQNYFNCPVGQAGLECRKTHRVNFLSWTDGFYRQCYGTPADSICRALVTEYNNCGAAGANADACRAILTERIRAEHWGRKACVKAPVASANKCVRLYMDMVESCGFTKTKCRKGYERKIDLVINPPPVVNTTQVNATNATAGNATASNTTTAGVNSTAPALAEVHFGVDVDAELDAEVDAEVEAELEAELDAEFQAAGESQTEADAEEAEEM